MFQKDYIFVLYWSYCDRMCILYHTMGRLLSLFYSGKVVSMTVLFLKGYAA